jgi:hypothetical protein
LYLYDKVVGTETSCISASNNTWRDSQASITIYVGQPNTWLIFGNNTPWLLLSFNDEIYSSDSYQEGNFTDSNDHSIQYTYSILQVNGSNNIPHGISINQKTGKITFDYQSDVKLDNMQVMVGDNTTNPDIYQHYHINTIIFKYDTYDIYNIQFGELEIFPGTMNFTYNGSSEDIINKKYVTGRCTFILVNQLSLLKTKQTWQWQTEILQNNKKAYLTGTIITNAETLLTPGNLWNLILSEQQKALCLYTINNGPISRRGDWVSYLYAVGKTDELQASKLYLYITINSV